MTQEEWNQKKGGILFSFVSLRRSLELGCWMDAPAAQNDTRSEGRGHADRGWIVVSRS